MQTHPAPGAQKRGWVATGVPGAKKRHHTGRRTPGGAGTMKMKATGATTRALLEQLLHHHAAGEPPHPQLMTRNQSRGFRRSSGLSARAACLL